MPRSIIFIYTVLSPVKKGQINTATFASASSTPATKYSIVKYALISGTVKYSMILQFLFVS